MKNNDSREALARQRFLHRGNERLLTLEAAGSLPGMALLVYSLWQPNPWFIALGLALTLLGLGANATRNIRAFGRMDEYERLTFLKGVAAAFIFLMVVVEVAGALLLFTQIRPMLVGLALLLSFPLAFAVLSVAQTRIAQTSS